VVLKHSVTAEFDLINLDSPEILTKIAVPSEVFNGELISIVPAKSYVADFMVTCKVE